VQSFTACMPLLTAANAFILGKDAGVLLNSAIYTASVPSKYISEMRAIFLLNNSINIYIAYQCRSILVVCNVFLMLAAVYVVVMQL